MIVVSNNPFLHGSDAHARIVTVVVLDRTE
jgi:hypothetical protein